MKHRKTINPSMDFDVVKVPSKLDNFLMGHSALIKEVSSGSGKTMWVNTIIHGGLNEIPSDYEFWYEIDKTEIENGSHRTHGSSFNKRKEVWGNGSPRFNEREFIQEMKEFIST